MPPRCSSWPPPRTSSTPTTATWDRLRIGRFGRSSAPGGWGAAAQAFAEADIGYKIIEQQPERILDEHYVLGDAADIAVLEAAGIRTATGVLITAHDDDINIYLTIYCRRLQPHLQIVARANLDRNVSTLYRAGADDVLSYASTGAAAVWNHLRGNDTLVVADGLDVFRSTVPRLDARQDAGHKRAGGRRPAATWWPSRPTGPWWATSAPTWC